MTGTAVSVCLLVLLSVCSACYISNCPIGGKRSIMDAPQRKVGQLREGFSMKKWDISHLLTYKSIYIETFLVKIGNILETERKKTTAKHATDVALYFLAKNKI